MAVWTFLSSPSGHGVRRGGADCGVHDPLSILRATWEYSHADSPRPLRQRKSPDGGAIETRRSSRRDLAARYGFRSAADVLLEGLDQLRVKALQKDIGRRTEPVTGGEVSSRRSPRLDGTTFRGFSLPQRPWRVGVRVLPCRAEDTERIVHAAICAPTTDPVAGG